MLVLRHMTKTKWGRDEVLDVIEKVKEFITENNGKFPSRDEFCKENGLPTARTVERNLGSLGVIRAELGFPPDLRVGEIRSRQVSEFNERGYYAEGVLYKLIRKYLAEPFVHKQYPLSDKTKHRADYCLFVGGNKYIIDAFTARDLRSSIGCLNHKMRKYKTFSHDGVPVIFVHMNEEINEKEFEERVIAKKNKMMEGQELMGMKQFKLFLEKITDSNIVKN